MTAPPGRQDERERYKRVAAERAVDEVTSGMVVGLGGGTTAAFAIRRIGELLRAGRLRDVRGVPCSAASAALARASGVPLTSLEDVPAIDLTIDGADEVDPRLNLIKGGGGALLHEKIVAQASRRELIVVDDAKPSPALGTRWPVPVEVVPFGWGSQDRFLRDLGARVVLRLTTPSPGTPDCARDDPPNKEPDGAPFRTDEGNLILDCHFGPVAGQDALAALAARLDGRAGIVEHGLFLGLASEVIVAGPDGVRRLTGA